MQGPARTLVAGVDSSTQSTKVLVCDAQTGAIVREGRAPHPEGSEVHPDVWWDAFKQATSGGLLDGVQAISVSGQQHGMVVLDDCGAVVRPALLWNDTRSADAALDLVNELGGPAAWAQAVGTVPVASLTITKLRWLAANEPELAPRVHDVALPHDWLTGHILADGSRTRAELVTDRGDASGTGYWSPTTGEYRPDLLELAFGRVVGVPRVLQPSGAAGRTASGLLVAPGTGDNMGAALGMDLSPGDVVVSLGTSGTVFAVHDRPTSDPSGFVAGFADATGRFLPLVCTLNAARVLTAGARMLGTDLAGLDALALKASPGSGGLTLLPYLDGERTPSLPKATGTLGGLRRDNMSPENVARAHVEGMLCGLVDGLDALTAQGIRPHRVLLIGGAARSRAVQTIAPEIFELPVALPEPAEYVALGAARQAAWSLAAQTGKTSQPHWPTSTPRMLGPAGLPGHEAVRAAYRSLLETVHGAAKSCGDERLDHPAV
jgi:xylulokinase